MPNIVVRLRGCAGATRNRRRVLALATDFPAVWRDPKTPDRERKRMLAENVLEVLERHALPARGVPHNGDDVVI